MGYKEIVYEQDVIHDEINNYLRWKKDMDVLFRKEFPALDEEKKDQNLADFIIFVLKIGRTIELSPQYREVNGEILKEYGVYKQTIENSKEIKTVFEKYDEDKQTVFELLLFGKNNGFAVEKIIHSSESEIKGVSDPYSGSYGPNREATIGNAEFFKITFTVFIQSTTKDEFLINKKKLKEATKRPLVMSEEPSLYDISLDPRRNRKIVIKLYEPVYQTRKMIDIKA